MKNVLTIVLVIADAVLLVLSLLMFAAGYPAWGVVALLAAGGLVYAAARFWLNSPQPEQTEWDEDIEYGASSVELRRPYWDPTLVFPDPVDEHAAQAIRALSGQPAVLPELPLLMPGRRPDLHDERQAKRYYDGLGDV